MRFDHMELTVAHGSLTSEFCQEVDAFYGAVFGWSAFDSQVGNRTAHLLQPDPNQFILLVESDTPMSVQGIEHLGLLLDLAPPRSTSGADSASATPRKTTGSRSCARTTSCIRLSPSTLSI